MSKVLFNTKGKTENNKNEEIPLDTQLERLKVYLKSEKVTRTGKEKPLTDQSVLDKINAVKACINHTKPCDFSQNWINQLGAKLEELNRSSSTRMAYMYAIKDYYCANGHEYYYVINEHNEKEKVYFKFAIPTVTTKESEYHSIEEIERLIKKAGNERDEALLTVAYYCALRNKELRFLYVADVDLKNRVLYVRDHGQGIKSKEERKVPFPQKAVAAIVKWLEVRNSISEIKDLPYMFLGQEGERLSLEGITALVHRAGKRAGIVSHPHELRHSRCTHLLDAKMPIHQVQKIMGHKSIKTTQKYSHADLSTIAASIDSIDI